MNVVLAAAIVLLSLFVYSEIARSGKRQMSARQRAAERFSIRESLLRAIAKVESNENPKAVGGAGELGMYQMKKIAYTEVVNRIPDLQQFPWPEAVVNDETSHYFAAAYLSILRDVYGFRDEFDMLRAYNQGPTKARNNQYAGYTYAERVLFTEGHLV